MSKRPYRLFPVPLASGLTQPMQRVLQRRGLDHAPLLHYWPEAVGESFAPYAQPLRLSGGRGKNGGKVLTGAVLTVKIHPAYATLFAYETEAVLQRLTTLLGYRPADRISLVQ